MPTTMLEVSDDYEALLLNINEQTVYDTPALQHIIRAGFPCVGSCLRSRHPTEDHESKHHTTS